MIIYTISFAKELFIIGTIHWISTSFNYNIRKIKFDGNTVIFLLKIYSV